MVAQNMLRTFEGDQIVMSNDFKFEAPVHVNHYLEQLELHNLLHACAMNSDLPSYLTAMG